MARPKSNRTSAATPLATPRGDQEPRLEPPRSRRRPFGQEREPEKPERERPVRRVRPDEVVGHDRHRDERRGHATENAAEPRSDQEQREDDDQAVQKPDRALDAHALAEDLERAGHEPQVPGPVEREEVAMRHGTVEHADA